MARQSRKPVGFPALQYGASYAGGVAEIRGGGPEEGAGCPGGVYQGTFV